MTKRMLLTTGLAVAAMLTIFVPSAVAQYQPTGSQVLSESVVRAGQTITVSGTGCPANAAVRTRFDDTPVGTTAADGTGAFALRVTIPADASPGRHTITSTCGTLVLSSAITVQGSSAPPSGGAVSEAGNSGTLPRTGTNSTIPLTEVGIALLAVGGILLVIGRKKRRSVAI